MAKICFLGPSITLYVEVLVDEGTYVISEINQGLSSIQSLISLGQSLWLSRESMPPQKAEARRELVFTQFSRSAQLNNGYLRYFAVCLIELGLNYLATIPSRDICPPPLPTPFSKNYRQIQILGKTMYVPLLGVALYMDFIM